MTIGTMQLSDLLVNQTGFQTVASFGTEKAAVMVQADLDAHQAVLTDVVSEIASPTTDKLDATGTTAAMTMRRFDEYGKPVTQKVSGAYNLGYPLEKWGIGIGWTREWFRTHTLRDLAVQTLAAEAAHVAAVYAGIRQAIYLSANYSFVDEFGDGPIITIPVKRLVNADGLAIAPGPNGEAFDGATHTHYLANATLTAAFGLSLVNTVLEHRVTGGVRIAIAQADRTAWEALTGFKALNDPRIQYVATDTNRASIDITRMNNLQIGTFSAAEVWVKPWAVSSYPLAYDSANPSKPLRYRQRNGEALQGLQTAAQNDAFPLHAEFMEAHFGFGVRERTAAAVLDNAHASYTDPTV